MVAVVAALLFQRQRTDHLDAALRRTQHDLADLNSRVGALSRTADATASATAAAADGLGRLSAEVHQAPDPASTAARVTKSVFVVKTPGGLGSAFVVGHNGPSTELITNAHVVADVWAVGGRGVELRQGDKSLPATILQFNDTYDLALLETPGSFDVLPFADARGRAGQSVLVVGAPLGLEGSVSSGVISSYRTEEGIEYMQVSAAINPGNSGGPVVDLSGHVLGVSVRKLVGVGIEGLGFAIPGDRVCAIFTVCKNG